MSRRTLLWHLVNTRFLSIRQDALPGKESGEVRERLLGEGAERALLRDVCSVYCVED